jgi:hypothetical protein
MRDDFESRFAAAKRRHDRFARLVRLMIAVIWISTISAVTFGVYLVATASPEELGELFGRMVSGFRDGDAR